jgi:hypothetical protein
MQYGPKIVINGLVFYVNAADRKSYAGTGTTWKDISTNGLSGVNCLQGTPSPVFSASNGGYLTTGAYDSGKYFDWGTGVTPVNFTSSNFTISLMFKPNSGIYGGGQMGIFGYGQENNYGYWMQISKVSTNKLSFFTAQFGNTQTTTSSDFSSYSGKWVYLTIVRNGTSVRIYANNVDITETAGTHTNPASNTVRSLTLAKSRQNDGSLTFTTHADYASFIMYNRALSASELTRNFDSHRLRFGL